MNKIKKPRIQWHVCDYCGQVCSISWES